MFYANRQKRKKSHKKIPADKWQIFLVDQKQLAFGHNKKGVDINQSMRPVVINRILGDFVYALPCTTNKKIKKQKAFFALTPPRVNWFFKRKQNKDSFAYYKYEKLFIHQLKNKKGELTKQGRLDILQWILEL